MLKSFLSGIIFLFIVFSLMALSPMEFFSQSSKTIAIPLAYSATGGRKVAGGEFEVTSSRIQEDLPNKKIPVRLGIDITGPVQHAVIKLKIEPAKSFLFFRW